MLYQLSVVGHEGARRSEVDHTARLGRDLTIEMDMRHHIVAESPLELCRPLEIDLIPVAPHRLDRLLRDRQPELPLCLGERDPEPTPRPNLESQSEDPAPLR